MNIYTKKGALAVAAAMLTLGAMPASANDTGLEFDDGNVIITCELLDVGELRWVFNTYVTVNPKDETSMNLKLDEALAKEEEAKYCDAGQKVDDFAAKIVRLQGDTNQPKISDAYNGAAIECVLVAAQHQADRYRALEGNCADPGDPPRGKGRNK